MHPAITLSEEEAERLAAALENVQRHYPKAKLLSDKHMAIVALASCCGRIYAPRVAIVLGVAKPAQPAEPEPAHPVAVEFGAPPAGADPSAWFSPPGNGAVQ